MFLEKILNSCRERRPADLASLKARAADAEPPRGFARALREAAFPAIIAEIKRASPSRGDLRPDLEPAQLAAAYEAGGAAALSVLTEGRFFKGSLDDLRQARAACSVPVLRKDFLLAPWELYEARAAGADAVLLIAAALDADKLADMAGLAQELGMDVLFEVHDAQELEAVRTVEPRIVGINNRDLRTFVVDLETTKNLASRLPEGVLRVSESGFFGPSDLAPFRGLVEAFLVGESLVTAPDPKAALEKLRGKGAPVS